MTGPMANGEQSSSLQTTMNHKKDQIKKAKLLGELFPRWDLDGNGFIDYDEMYQVVSMLQKGTTRHDRKAWAKWLQTARALHRSEGFGIAEFTGLLEDLTSSLDMPEFVAFLANVNHAIEKIHSTPHGQRAKKIRELFLKWDVDGNGFVSFDELDLVFEASDAFLEHKALRKAIRRKKLERLQEAGQFACQLNQQEFSELLTSVLGPMEDEVFFSALEQFSHRLDIVLLAIQRLEDKKRRNSLRQKLVLELEEDDGVSEMKTPRVASPLPLRPTFEEDDSAIMIQAAFRGFKVRQRANTPTCDLDISLSQLPTILQPVALDLDEVDLNLNLHPEDCTPSIMQHQPNRNQALKRMESKRTVFAKGLQVNNEFVPRRSLVTSVEMGNRTAIAEDLFLAWDMNRNGFVDPDEMAKVLQRLESQRAVRQTYGNVIFKLWEIQPNALDVTAFKDAFLRSMASVKDEEFAPLILCIDQILTELVGDTESNHCPDHVPDTSRSIKRLDASLELTIADILDAMERKSGSPDDERSTAVAALFPKWDFNGDGIIDSFEFRQVVSRLEEQRAFRETFGGLLIHLWQVEQTSFEEEEFVKAFLSFTDILSDEEFQAVLAALEQITADIRAGQTSRRTPVVVELTEKWRIEPKPLEINAGCSPPKSELAERERAIRPLFLRWDLNGDSVVDQQELKQVLQQLERQRAFREVFGEVLVKLWEINESLGLEAFLLTLLRSTASVTADEFSPLLEGLGQAADKARKQSGSKPHMEPGNPPNKRRISKPALDVAAVKGPMKSHFPDDDLHRWREGATALFFKWDLNRDGVVDPSEWTQVLQCLEQSRTFRETFGDVLVNLWAVDEELDYDTFVTTLVCILASVEPEEFPPLQLAMEQAGEEAQAQLQLQSPRVLEGLAAKRPAAIFPTIDVSTIVYNVGPHHIAETEVVQRQEAVMSIFPRLDINANGIIDPSELDRVLRYLQSQRAFRETFGELLVNLWEMEDQGLDQSTFAHTFLRFTARLSADEFAALMAGVDQALIHLVTKQNAGDSPKASGPRGGQSVAVILPPTHEPPEAHAAEKRGYIISGLFPRWDLNGNGVLDPPEVVQVLRQLEEQHLFRKQFVRLLGPMWTMQRQGLDREGFVDAIIQLTDGLSADEFAPFVLGLEQALNEVSKMTTSPLNQAMWTLFQALDTKEQGWMDLPTFEPMLHSIPSLSSGQLSVSPAWSNPVNNRAPYCQFYHLMTELLEGHNTDEAIQVLSKLQKAVAERGHGLSPQAHSSAKWTSHELPEVRSPISRHELEVRRSVITGMFKEWDLNGSGLVEPDELRHIIHTVCEMRTSFPKSLLSDLLTNQATAFLALEERPFTTLLLDATRPLRHDGFREFMDASRTAVDHCRAMRTGPRNAAIWELFDLWDEDKDGYIYFSELATAVGHMEHSGLSSQNIQTFSLSWRKAFDAFERTREHTLSLNQFHRFLEAVYKNLPDKQFIGVVRELRKATKVALAAELEAKDSHAAETLLTSNPSTCSLGHVLSPRTTESIRELLSNRPVKAPKGVPPDAYQQRLLFDIRHALDGIQDTDIRQAVIVSKGEKSTLFSLCAALCLLLRYYKVEAHLDAEECVGLVQQQLRMQGQLLHDVVHYNPQKTMRPVVEKVLALYESDPIGLVACRLFAIGRLWSSLCNWVRHTVSYIISLNPKWKLVEPKVQVFPEVRTPRTLSASPILEIAPFPPHGGGAMTIISPRMCPRYNSELRKSTGPTALPPVESRYNKSVHEYRSPLSLSMTGSFGLPRIGGKCAVSHMPRESSFSSDLDAVSEQHEFMFTEGEIREEFEKYDWEGKGWIWKEEFRQTYQAFDLLGRNEPSKMEALLKKFGTVDGKLNFTEFSILMLKIAQR